LFRVRRLSNATLGDVPAGVLTPAYDRAATRMGIVHFGPGAFHRAHQASYVERILDSRPDLAICAVSLRTPDLRDALAPQDGLYTLAERDAEPRLQVIGAIRQVLVAAEAPAVVLARLVQARIVTATVTEKGYALTAAGDLDLDHPDIRHDLQTPRRPVSLVGWLTEGLRSLKVAGLAPFTTISCDNLSGNGGKLGRAVARFAEACGDRDLAGWIAERAAFPNSMVDSITPATDAGLRADVAAALGLTDAWPVQRERFLQWVVEDRLGADAEAFATAGVTLARDVAPFERAKLRLLNGAHSALAYLGLRLGHATVSRAMADAALAAFVERMMRQDIAASLTPGELDVPAYIGEVLARFRNPAIGHRLAQIAWDGSQKLPFRLLETITDALDAGRPMDRLAVPVAAWMDFVRRAARDSRPITDPLAATLETIGGGCDGSAADVARFLALEAIFPVDLASDPRLRGALERAYVALAGPSPETALSF
jgi:fructuronate reductase